MHYILTLSNRSDSFVSNHDTVDELQTAYRSALKLTNGTNANEWQIDVSVEVTRRATICDSICSPEQLAVDIAKLKTRADRWSW